MARKTKKDTNGTNRVIFIILVVLFLPIMATIQAVKTKSRNWILAAIGGWLFYFLVWALPDDISVFIPALLALIGTGLLYAGSKVFTDFKKKKNQSINDVSFPEHRNMPVISILAIERTQPRKNTTNVIPTIETTQPRQVDLTPVDSRSLSKPKPPVPKISIEIVGSHRRSRSNSSNSRALKGKSLMDLPNSYVVIDVETTGFNPNSDGIIEIGAIRVRDGEIIDRYQQLVHPDISIPEHITEINGITDAMVRSAPKIGSVVGLFDEFIGNDILVGHNVNFDVNFLYEAYIRCMESALTNDFVDTLRFARYLYPEFPDHKLPTLVNRLGIAETTVHRALSDTVYTHQVYQRMRTHIIDNAMYIPNLSKSVKLITAKDIQPMRNSFDIRHPVYGKVFSFTGVLNQMTRRQAMQAVMDFGGKCSDNMTKKVNYLVLGDDVSNILNEDNRPYKCIRADKLISEGINISIIRSTEFEKMVNLMGLE